MAWSVPQRNTRETHTSIVNRAENRFMLIEPDGVLMVVGYGLRMRLLFQVSG